MHAFNEKDADAFETDVKSPNHQNFNIYNNNQALCH